jgi:rod shape-determining protein MreD
MAFDTLKRAFWFLALCLAQALVLNRVQLFNCAMPLLYVYFVIMFPRNYPKWAILVWSFALGLTIDLFANTPGVATTSLTLVGAVQPYLLTLFLPRDANDDLPVGASTLGWGKFAAFTLLIVVLFCLAFFSLEAFNYFNWQHWLACAGGSAALTIALILTLETIRK